MPVFLLSMILFLLSGAAANASIFPDVSSVQIRFWYSLEFEDGMGYEDMGLCRSSTKFHDNFQGDFEQAVADQMVYAFGFSPANVHVEGDMRTQAPTYGSGFIYKPYCRFCDNDSDNINQVKEYYDGVLTTFAEEFFNDPGPAFKCGRHFENAIKAVPIVRMDVDFW